MKNIILKLGAAAMALSFFAGAELQAAPHVVVVPNFGNVQVMHDVNGIPIWGYGSRGRAIYAYSPEGLPVYAFERIYSGCYVPPWDFLPVYHGPMWPRGIHKNLHKNFHFSPGAPRPGGHAPHPGPGPKPGAHKPGQGGPKPGAHKPGPGGPKPGAHKPGQGGPKPGAHKPGQGGAKPGAHKPGQGGARPGAHKPGQGGHGHRR